MAQRATAKARAPTGGASSLGVGILGVTGYAGAEAVRLLAGHPRAALLAASARQAAGQPLGTVLPGLALPPELAGLEVEGEGLSPAAWRRRGVEVLLSCLPHGVLAARAEDWLAADVRVIDLSGDFRLRRADAYLDLYGYTHPAAPLLAEACYGLTEWCGEPLDAARLVANPGCYATAMLLATLPAAAAGWLAPAPLVITAMSGVTGAGRVPSLRIQLGEAHASVAPYRVGQEHAHLGEVAQALAQSGFTAPVLFNPHLLPIARGICAVATLPLASSRTAEAAQALYATTYAEHPFVEVLPASRLPEIRFVRGSNRCDLAVRIVAEGQVLQVHAALDNLLKGAAGQALQNLNRLAGWPETLGLPRAGWPCA